MKLQTFVPVLGLIASISLPTFAAEQKPLTTQAEKVSYAIGVDIGRTLKSQGIDVDADILTGAIKDALSDAELKLNDEEMRSTMLAFQKEMMSKAAAASKKAGEKAAKAGSKFLAQKKEEEGIKGTDSGLLYKVIEAGKGAKPRLSDTVSVNYRGTLIDGTEFDSSYKRGEPATFPVDQVIPGWTEALQLMPIGSKYELYIPSDLAYGENGAGGIIGPNETLIFEVELLAIVEGEEKSE
jgi:FKBP-type peptidyl-prolyl cis-trans isomerase FklB